MCGTKGKQTHNETQSALRYSYNGDIIAKVSYCCEVRGGGITGRYNDCDMIAKVREKSENFFNFVRKIDSTKEKV